MIEERVSDGSILRLIGKWINVGSFSRCGGFSAKGNSQATRAPNLLSLQGVADASLIVDNRIFLGLFVA